ncbi:MAG: methionine--tRNA ligase [Bdellovibrionaceae bacterium]|nr:methionine--tRNA ligase [Pseudobdellovibrionaceae bacterium]
MNKTIFVTTSIPYVNSRPHVGHAQEFIIADCIARIYRALQFEVIFQSGTDENAFKNVVAAASEGISVQELVDKNAVIFRNLLGQLNISIDTFIRTTEPRHRRGVELFWSLIKRDDLYAKSYDGLYCIGCEDFFLQKDLVDGLCPDHKAPPELISEQNVFFRLSRYQTAIEELILSDQIKIAPVSRKNEALGFIRQGLQDISLTRAKSRSGGWGISAPDYPDQVIYVWIDALINYLTGQGFGESADWQRVWNKDSKKIHVIGKNVWKFHAIYWPALLLSAGLPPPNEIVVHGFLTNNGIKISKSLGNAIDPLAVVEKFGSDPIRHLLLSQTPIYGDSDFSIERLGKIYSGDLANKLGNLLSRLLALCDKAQFQIQFKASGLKTLDLSKYLDDYSLQEISQIGWIEIDKLNAEINQKRPWALLNADAKNELHPLLDDWCQRLFQVANNLEPFVPDSSKRIQTGLEGREIIGRILFPQKT